MHTLSPNGANIDPAECGAASDTETQRMSKTVLLKMGGLDLQDLEDRESQLDVFAQPTVMSSIFARERTVSERDGAMTPKHLHQVTMPQGSAH